jgi:hypothetical protein
MEEIDIRRIANLMMRLHGPSAQRKAVLQANKMRAMGDGTGFHAWTRVGDTITDLERNNQAPASP